MCVCMRVPASLSLSLCVCVCVCVCSQTTSQIEWLYVVDPIKGLTKLRGVIETWPHEAKLLEASAAYRAARVGTPRSGSPVGMATIGAADSAASLPELQRESSTASAAHEHPEDAAALAYDPEDPRHRMREPQSLAYFEAEWAKVHPPHIPPAVT